jgi:hypothetical protein
MGAAAAVVLQPQLVAQVDVLARAHVQMAFEKTTKA